MYHSSPQAPTRVVYYYCAQAFFHPRAPFRPPLQIVSVLVGPVHFLELEKQYPLPSPPPVDYRDHIATIGTDGLFVCATRNATSSLVLAQQRGARKSPVFVYMYNHLMSFSKTYWGPAYSECYDAICHGADLPQVFHPDYPQYGTNYTADEDTLSWSMMAYWASLAANGTTGTGWAGTAPLDWPAYSLSDRQSMAFDTPVNTIAAGYKAANCTFWDTHIGYYLY